ncbi:aminopeptidase N-like [Pogonomyrmex barbatus]|uniref:Aminopeptidase n=1 Tax=Pogonomyrmex barbatus TaxID=144034 RepID=A0A8N1S5R7_9HYME|nr:aminopeptidase N-like [Pogonomyrmex barbatus]
MLRNQGSQKPKFHIGLFYNESCIAGVDVGRKIGRHNQVFSPHFVRDWSILVACGLRRHMQRIMNIMELIKLLLYGSLILSYVTALYQHKENVFDKPTISNKQTDRSQTTRTRRSEKTEIISNDTHAHIYIVSTTCSEHVTTVLVNFRLPDFIIPKEYKIDLRLNTEEDIFSGMSNITILINKTTQNINLHSANLEITNCTLTGIIDGEIKMYAIRNLNYIHELQIIVLDFIDTLYPDEYNLSMRYKGVIDNDVGGFIKIPYINAIGHKKWLFATNNTATGMRRLFPCWDEPGIKAKFTIAIKYPEHYNVFSNILSLRSSLTVTEFVTTPEIPTYRIAILLLDKNDYTYISPVQNLELWRRKSVEEQWNQILELIKDVTVAVKFMWRPKEYLMRNKYAIAGLTGDSVDKLQFELYREEDIIYNEEIDPIARKIELSRIIGRKVVGQVFGTAVSPSWWSYMWLNEGIATLFGVYIINQTMPDIRMLDLFVVQTQQESLRLDDSQIMKPLDSEVNSISEINSLFSFTYYIKAPSILRMLHHTVGDEIFQKGIKAYMKRKTGSLDDFWTVMQSVYDSQTMDLEKINVKGLMNPWIQKKQYPILNVTETFEWTQIVIKTASKPWYWTVPLTNQVYINLKRILPNFCLTREQKHFLAKYYPDCPDSQFIIINQQQTGYYRVFYNLESWLRIVNCLNSENYTNINVLNRAQIIDDTFHLTISGELESSIFWEVASYLKWETDYIPWYSMFKAAEHMLYILPFHSTDSAIFKTKLLMQLVPLLEKIGYEEEPNDDSFIKCLRQEALRWACILGDSKCKKHAEFKLQWHLSNTT